MKKEILICLTLILPLSYLHAGEIQSDELLFKMAQDEWSVVQLQSHELSDSNLTTDQMEQKVKQAVIWLEVANRLIGKNKYVLGNLEYLYRSEMVNDPGRAMNTLIEYSDICPKDNLCVDGWMKYRLSQLNQRSHRDYFIESMEQNLSDYPMVLSDMLTLRGIFAAEQGGIDKAAHFYENAWNIWPYNIDAASRLLSLPLPQVSIDDPSISIDQKQMLEQQIEQNYLLRSIYYHVMSLTNNPNNVDAAVGLADLLYSLNKFEKAALFYSHGVKLLNEIDAENPNQQVLNGLAFKQAICLFNSGKYLECDDLLSRIVNKEKIDLPIAALSILTLKKLDKAQEAVNLIERVNIYANSLIKDENDIEKANQVHSDLAWLYCFAAEDMQQAISHAGMIKQDDSGEMSPLLAYLQLKAGEFEDARDTLSKCPPDNPLSLFTSALMELNDSRTEEASELLELSLVSSPGLLYSVIEAKIKQVNSQAISNDVHDDVVDSILNQFSEEILDIAFNPELYIQYSINPTQNFYKYDDAIIADLSITNISQVDRILGPTTMIDPYIYIYGEIVPAVKGDIKPKVFPISLRYLAQEPVLRPGFSNIVQDVLNIGKLDDILSVYPQMGYKIKFHCIPSPYIDNGKILSNTPKLTPEPVVIERRAFNASPQRLSSYYTMLRTGQPDDRIRAARLFAAILKENQLAAKNKLFYKSVKLDYKKTVKSILANISHENPSIRAWTVYSLKGLLKEDKSVINQVTAKLDDSDWFVRLMALNVLHKVVNIDSVVKWFAENEKDETILRQIHLWQGEKWEKIEVPFDIPDKI